VRIAAAGWAVSPATDQVIAEQPVFVQLVDGRLVWPADGQLGVPVVDPTDPGLEQPVLVELHLLLDDTKPQFLVLNIATENDTIDVADAPRVPVEEQADRPVPVVPWSAVGAAGGVAPLGADRHVPAQFLPPAVGGVPAFEFVQEVPQSVVTVQHGLGFRPRVAAFSLDWSTEYDEFATQHVDENTVVVSMDNPRACVLVMS
jgi:hypothetical protein